MNNNEIEVCKNCKYWDQINPKKNANTGFCHRYPPQTNCGSVTKWPKTFKFECCGEFMPIQEEQESDTTEKRIMQGC
jgi:hypothetical protein